VAVILGTNNPLEVELMSNLAETSGVVVPIPVWAFACNTQMAVRKVNKTKNFSLFI
jgi:hypothetical protein